MVSVSVEREEVAQDERSHQTDDHHVFRYREGQNAPFSAEMTQRPRSDLKRFMPFGRCPKSRISDARPAPRSCLGLHPRERYPRKGYRDYVPDLPSLRSASLPLPLWLLVSIALCKVTLAHLGQSGGLKHLKGRRRG